MAHPFLSAKGLETGTNSEWDSETDTDSKLDFAHFSTTMGRYSALPYRGAYAMRVDLSGGTSDAYVQEDNDLDTSGTIHGSFYLWASPQLEWTMTDNDLFAIFRLQSSGPAEDGVIFLEDNAGTMTIGINETSATSGASIQNLPMGVWNLIEWSVNVSGNTFDGFLNGTAFGQISGTFAAIIQGQLGTIGIDSGTTAGVLLFDEFIVDDARIQGHRERFPSNSYWVTHNQHTHIGPGKAKAYITGTSTDAQAVFYDTDQALTADPPARIIGVARSADDSNSRDVDLTFNRGLYVELSGTNTQAFVTPHSTIWNGLGAARTYADRRRSVA